MVSDSNQPRLPASTSCGNCLCSARAERQNVMALNAVSRSNSLQFCFVSHWREPGRRSRWRDEHAFRIDDVGFDNIATRELGKCQNLCRLLRGATYCKAKLSTTAAFESLGQMLE